eukprot:scaffold12.g8196.t1
MGLSRLAFDSLSALVLGLTALLGAYTPVFLSARDRRAGGSGRSLTFVLLNMFSAGVMVSAGFCHLLGEAVKLMPQHHQFPLATFLCGTGFLLTLVADKIAHSASGGHHGHGNGNGGEHKHAGGECCAVNVLAGIDIAERGYAKASTEEEDVLLHGVHSPPPLCKPAAGGGGLANGGSHVGSNGVVAATPRRAPSPHEPAADGRAGSAAGDGGLDSSPEVTLLRAGSSAASTTSGGGGRTVLHRHGTPVFEVEMRDDASSSSGGSSGGAGPRLIAPVQLVQRVARISFLTAMLMGVALCFHSLLEGAAMGAQETVSNSLHIFIAIVSHKGLAAYALGSSIVDSEASSRRFWSVVLPFTLASPVGIFLGYIISDLAKGTGAAAISALASGTFLYVAFMEVIPRELHEGSHVPSKMAMLLAGFGAMPAVGPKSSRVYRNQLKHRAGSAHRAAQMGGTKRLQFVPTLFWQDTGPRDPPPGFDPTCKNNDFLNGWVVNRWCFDRNDCHPATQAEADRFRDALATCMRTAVDHGFDLAVNMHVDDATNGGLGGWRNTLEFDPTTPYSGMRRVRRHAFSACGAGSTQVYLIMQGEMGATIFFSSAAWLRVAGETRARVAPPDPAHLHIGLGINNAKLCGCILVGIVDHREYLAKFPAAFEQVKSEFDVSAIQQLFKGVDFIGISAYIPMPVPQFQVCELEGLMTDLDTEFSFYGLTLKELSAQGKELHWIEFGVGGGTSPTGDKKATTAEASTGHGWVL